MCSLYWKSVRKKPMVIKTRTSIGAPNLHPHKLPTTALLQQHKMFLQIFIQTNFAGCTTRRWCGQSSSCCSWRLKHLQPPAVAATAKTSHDASKKIKKGRERKDSPSYPKSLDTWGYSSTFWLLQSLWTAPSQRFPRISQSLIPGSALHHRSCRDSCQTASSRPQWSFWPKEKGCWSILVLGWWLLYHISLSLI